MLTGVKVALLTDCYLPRLGGIEVQVHDLARHLIAAGHEVSAFTTTRVAGQPYGTVEDVDGVRVHRLGTRLAAGVPINPFAAGELRRRLAAGGFDVAHAHLGVIAPFAMDAVRIATTLGLPTAITWHSVHAGATPLVQAAGWVRRWAARGAALSAVSHVAAAPVARLAGPQHLVNVVPNAIDLDQWRPAPRQPDPARVRVVSALRLARRKRPVALLEAVAQVRRRCPGVDVRLLLLGEGPQRKALERRAAALHADWLEAPGRRTREELRAAYLDGDAYVAPARLEAFGIAALEARATGLPIVAPQMSGVSEFVRDGVEGLLAEDDAGLVDALVRLVEDPQLRARLTDHNTYVAPEQTWHRVTAAVEAEYARAVTLQGAA